MISLKLRTVHGLLFAMGNTLHADSQRQSGIALEVGVSFIIEALPGGEGCVARPNFKTSRVGVYKCLSLMVGFAITVAIWPREVVMSLVAILF